MRNAEKVVRRGLNAVRFPWHVVRGSRRGLVGRTGTMPTKSKSETRCRRTSVHSAMQYTQRLSVRLAPYTMQQESHSRQQAACSMQHTLNNMQQPAAPDSIALNSPS